MLFATIMAGGAGTRFWPASRKQNPKQLLNLIGQRSMLQSTVDRLHGLVPPDNLLIVTNQALVEPIAAQLPDLPRDCVIGEPAKRDTAPCIGLAAAWIAAQDEDATMIVSPADHVIEPVERFQAALKQAVEIVEQDPKQLVTFGIQPSYPAEVFGYIERAAAPVKGLAIPTFPVVRFREKPDRKTAAEFLEAGTFCWNSGIFVWKARTILNALKEYEPEMYQHVEAIAKAVGTRNFHDVLKEEFGAIKGKSIDFAVMERHPHVTMIEAPFEWDDLGNWSAVPRRQGVDSNGNTIQAKHLGVDTQGTIIRGANEHLIVTIGVKDLVIVQTGNATLIADKNNETGIKEIIAQLEKNQWDEYL